LFFGQIDIQNDEGGTGHLRVIVGPIEKTYRLLSIPDDMQRERESGCLHRLMDQKHVGLIIFDNKHMAVGAGGCCIRRGA